MKTTVWAVIARVGDVAAERSLTGRLLGGHAFNELDHKLGGSMIDLDHDGNTVGEIVYAERGDQDQIEVVGVLDGNWIERVTQPVFMSGEWEMRGSNLEARSFVAREAQLRSVALTLDPCNLAARPVQWLRGDLRRETDQRSWSLLWRTDHPLLARAFDQLRGLGSESRTASQIVDRRARGDDFPLTAGSQI